MQRNTHLQNLFLVCALLCFIGLFSPPSAEAVVKRGKISLNGRYSVRANGCQLKFGAKSTASVTRIKCTGTGKAQAGASGRGIAFLRQRDSIVLTGKSCFFATLRQSKRRIDLRCQATDPNATPTPTPTPTVTPTPNMVFLTDGGGSLGIINRIVKSNIEDPTAYPISSLCTNTMNGIWGLLTDTETSTLVAADIRPQNGMFYALGTNSNGLQLFTVTADTCTATKVGTTGTFVGADGTTPITVSGTMDMDFNPTVDRIRVVTSTGQNFRINPNTGAFVDGNLGMGTAQPGVNMDGDIQAGTTSVEGAAYTNNQANATVTTLYTLDHFSDKICRQTPANSGIQVCSALGTPFDTVKGFDIPPGVNTTASDVAVSSGFGYSFVKAVGGTDYLFAKIDLASGASTTLSTSFTGTNASNAISFAIMQPDGVAMIGLSAAGDNLLRFNSKTPGTTTTAAITGVTAGETLVGLDFRPSTGQLYSLGIDATADTGTLYTLDPQTGAATVVGSAGLIAFVDGAAATIELPDVTTGYGFNFNGVVDRVRVVTGNGLNFRINPTTGAPIDGDTGAAGNQPDTNINGSTTGIHAASYTNSAAGHTVTSLYTMSGTTNTLYLQVSPNTGTQAGPIPVTLSGAALDFAEVNGFNIPTDVRVTTSDTSVTTGDAFAALTVSGTTGLYSINLTTGAATSLGTIGTGSTAMSGLAVANRTVE